MLSLNDISLKINAHTVLNRLSMSFLPGAIIYLCGNNGSGKTSLLRIIAGITKPTSGYITLTKKNLPINVIKKPYSVYIGHLLAIKNDLTVYENIAYWAKIYNAEELIDASIVFFKIGDLLDKKCYELSEGNRKKIAMTRLILAPANIWLLDEIENNLDKDNKMLLNNLIVTKANNGGIVVITTHNKPAIDSGMIVNL